MNDGNQNNSIETKKEELSLNIDLFVSTVQRSLEVWSSKIKHLDSDGHISYATFENLAGYRIEAAYSKQIVSNDDVLISDKTVSAFAQEHFLEIKQVLAKKGIEIVRIEENRGLILSTFQSRKKVQEDTQTCIRVLESKLQNVPLQDSEVSFDIGTHEAVFPSYTIKGINEHFSSRAEILIQEMPNRGYGGYRVNKVIVTPKKPTEF